jgi:hypothetical protein
VLLVLELQALAPVLLVLQGLDLLEQVRPRQVQVQVQHRRQADEIASSILLLTFGTIRGGCGRRRFAARLQTLVILGAGVVETWEHSNTCHPP